MDTINTNLYYEMWNKLQCKEITEEVWVEYCNSLLSQILSVPSITAVMHRLKDR